MPYTYNALVGEEQGVTKRSRLSWLTNSAIVYEPKCGGRGWVAGPQPIGTAVNRSPNTLWRSNSIFNLRREGITRTRPYGPLFIRGSGTCSPVAQLIFFTEGYYLCPCSQYYYMVSNIMLYSWRETWVGYQNIPFTNILYASTFILYLVWVSK